MLALVRMWQDDPADALADGSVYDTWRRMVAAQGGRPDAPLPVVPHVEVVPASATGVLRRLDARAVGVAVWLLGAGRHRKHDPVSPVASVRWRAVPGERVAVGQPLLELHTADPARLERACAALAGAVEIETVEVGAPAPRRPLVLDRIAP